VGPFALAICLGERKSPSSDSDFRKTLVEPLSDVRTLLEDFFSILVDLQLGDSGNKQIEKIPISHSTLFAFRDKLDRDVEQG
jgi:hypothetical protein